MLARDPQTEAPAYNQSQLEFARNVLTPRAASYAVADPRLEVPRGFFDYHDGMGNREEDANPNVDTQGYEYGLYIDSGNGYIENGPTVTSTTPSNTGTIRQFFEVDVGGTRTVCALAGRYLLTLSGSTWTSRDDLGAGGSYFYRAATFRGTGDARAGVYLAVHDSADAPTTGRHWTTASTTTVFANITGVSPVTVAQHGEAIYFLDVSANNYRIRKSVDGTAAPTLSGSFLFDASGNATEMTVWDNRLLVGTTRGILAPTTGADLSTAVEELVPEMRFQYHADNCRGMTPWFQWLIVPFAQSLFRMDPETNKLQEFGPGTLPNNISEVKGQVTAVCGYREWTLFACLYDGTNSYLLRWGNWRIVDTEIGPQRIFHPGWHGALYKFASTRINAMFISAAAGGNPILHMGGTDGNIYTVTLPRFSMAWRSDSNCSFNTTNDGEVFFPIIHHGVPLEPKINLAVAMTNENLTGSTRDITVAYRTDTSSAFGGSSNIQSNGVFNTDPGSRQSFLVSVVGRMIQLKATLNTTTTATPCVLKSIAVYQTVRPTFKWRYAMQLRLGNNVQDRRLQTLGRYFAEDEQIDALYDATSGGGPVSFISLRGETNDALMTDLSIQAQPTKPGEPPEWLATVVLVQHRSTSVIGTWDRMGAYTWDNLGAYTWDQLASL